MQPQTSSLSEDMLSVGLDFDDDFGFEEEEQDIAVETKNLESRYNMISDQIIDGIGSLSKAKQEELIQERMELKQKIEHLKERATAQNDTPVITPVTTRTSSTHSITTPKTLPTTFESSSSFSIQTENQIVSPFFNNPVREHIPSIPTIKAPTVMTTTTEPTFPWSRDVKKALVQNFKLSDFRPNQLEAINTTLNGDDVFVLMPTGGGKSLCYQLPAIIQRYQTQGVTFVVSPLLSLMQDQVEQLVKGRGIAAGMLNSSVSPEQKRWIYNNLYQDIPTLQLLYITPELMSKSDQLRNVMDSLYKRKKLARFVIDEAHCVSQWGHDFRPDYKQLGSLKTIYPNIPIMALTATANDAVQKDVIHNLSITNCKLMKQSFNRKNLM